MNKWVFSLSLGLSLTVASAGFAFGFKEALTPEALEAPAAIMESPIVDFSAYPEMMNRISDEMNAIEEIVNSGDSVAVAAKLVSLSDNVREFSEHFVFMVPESYREKYDSLFDDYHRNLKEINMYLKQNNEEKARQAYYALVNNWEEIEELFAETLAAS